jgi:hypothetical protein
MSNVRGVPLGFALLTPTYDIRHSPAAFVIPAKAGIHLISTQEHAARGFPPAEGQKRPAKLSRRHTSHPVHTAVKKPPSLRLRSSKPLISSRD